MSENATTNSLALVDHPLNRPLTTHERAWIDFIRLASNGSDPAPTLDRVQKLRRIFSDRGGA